MYSKEELQAKSVVQLKDIAKELGYKQACLVKGQITVQY